MAAEKGVVGMNTWKQKSRLTQANLTSEPSANLAQERSPMVRYLQEAAAGEQSHPLELDKQMRSRMERQFGLDFSAVQLVESDLPGKLGADAIAQGDLIRFAPGAFHPETAQGEQLLSHELSHVVQQSRGQGMGGVAGMPWVDAGTESSADAMAAQAMSGGLPAEPARSISPAPAATAPMLCGRTKQGTSQPSHRRQIQRSTSCPDIPSQVVPRWLRMSVAKWLQTEQSKNEKPERPDWLLFQAMKNYGAGDVLKRYFEARTAWENRYQFNPQNVRKLRKTLNAIDRAKNVKQAQVALKRITGKKIGGKIGGNNINDLNLRSVKLRLKGMARMMHEFPQLQGQIRKFGGVPEANIDDHMVVTSLSRTMEWNGIEGAYLHGQSDDDGSNEYYRKRKDVREKRKREGYQIASGRWDGTHELGHTLQFMLDDQLLLSKYGNAADAIPSDPMKYYPLIARSRLTAASVVQQAISQLLANPNLDPTTKDNLNTFINVHTNPETGNDGHELTLEERSKKLDLLDYKSMRDSLFGDYGSQNFEIYDVWDQKAEDYQNKLNDLHEMGLTSQYGATGIADLFAEAFADYYGNGDEANPLSKKIVEIVKAQTASGGKPTAQQGDWVDNERSKVSAILKDIPTLKPMSDDKLTKKREEEQKRKGKGYTRPSRM